MKSNIFRISSQLKELLRSFYEDEKYKHVDRMVFSDMQRFNFDSTDADLQKHNFYRYLTPADKAKLDKLYAEYCEAIKRWKEDY